MTTLKLISIVIISLIMWNCSNEYSVSPVSDSVDNKSAYIVPSLHRLFSPSTNPYYTPSMVESGSNIEIARRSTSNDIQHYYWNSSVSNWQLRGTFGSDVCSDPAICVNYNDGWLQCLVRQSGQQGLAFYYCWNNQVWLYAGNFGYNYTGSPAMICNSEDNNLEFVINWNGNFTWAKRVNGIWMAEYQILSLPSGHVAKGDPAFIEAGNDSNGKYRIIAVASKYNDEYYLNIFRAGMSGTFTRVYSNKETQAYPKFALAKNRFGGFTELFYRKTSGYGLYSVTIESDGDVDFGSQSQLSSNWIYNIGAIGAMNGSTNYKVYMSYYNRSNARNDFSYVWMDPPTN